MTGSKPQCFISPRYIFGANQLIASLLLIISVPLWDEGTLLWAVTPPPGCWFGILRLEAAEVWGLRVWCCSLLRAPEYSLWSGSSPAPESFTLQSGRCSEHGCPGVLVPFHKSQQMRSWHLCRPPALSCPRTLEDGLRQLHEAREGNCFDEWSVRFLLTAEEGGFGNCCVFPWESPVDGQSFLPALSLPCYPSPWQYSVGSYFPSVLQANPQWWCPGHSWGRAPPRAELGST